MKAKLLVPAVVAIALSLPVFSAMAETPQNLLGEPAASSAADQTISITPDTKYVNVQGGEVVSFNVDGKTFAWDFDGQASGQTFDLNRVAPPGLLDHTVTAYVSPNPLYD